MATLLHPNGWADTPKKLAQKAHNPDQYPTSLQNFQQILIQRASILKTILAYQKIKIGNDHAVNGIRTND